MVDVVHTSNWKLRLGRGSSGSVGKVRLCICSVLQELLTLTAATTPPDNLRQIHRCEIIHT